MTRILHAADLHLDSRLRGLQFYPGAPAYNPAQSTRDAMARMVDMALEREVDLVLIAGDIYEGDWPDWDTGLFFLHQVSRLTREGIPVVCIRGNHDAANRITRDLTPPEKCFILRDDKPDSIRFPELNVVVHGQSYAKQRTEQNLTARYPDAEKGMINIGLLHTALTGREGHEPYAPCTPDDLLEKGYHYWALGHVHQYEVVDGTDGRVVFAGNTQGRHIRETGPRGVVLVEIDSNGNLHHQRLHTHTIRWELLRVSVSQVKHFDDVLDRVDRGLADLAAGAVSGELLAARIVLEGPTELDSRLRRDQSQLRAEARGLASQRLGERIWIEDVRLQTRPLRQRTEQVRIWDELLDDVIKEVTRKRSIPELLACDEIAALRSGLRRVMDRDRLEQWWDELTSDEALHFARAYLEAVLRDA